MGIPIDLTWKYSSLKQHTPAWRSLPRCSLPRCALTRRALPRRALPRCGSSYRDAPYRNASCRYITLFVTKRLWRDSYYGAHIIMSAYTNFNSRFYAGLTTNSRVMVSFCSLFLLNCFNEFSLEDYLPNLLFRKTTAMKSGFCIYGTFIFTKKWSWYICVGNRNESNCTRFVSYKA